MRHGRICNRADSRPAISLLGPQPQQIPAGALIADAGRGDWIACQITSNPYADPRAVEITESDFSSGILQRTSYVRPGKLFTANEKLFSSAPATVITGKLDGVRAVVMT